MRQMQIRDTSGIAGRAVQRGLAALAAGLCLAAAAIRAEAMTQISQEVISATASNTYGTDVPSRAIDGNLGTYWQTRLALPQWIQLDLGQAHWVSQIELYSGASYRIRGYEVYVADDPDPEDWGTALATGELPSATAWNTIPFDPTYGRYLRLVPTSQWTSGRIYLYELRVYERDSDAFLADQQTGSTDFTNTDTVDVLLPRVSAEYDQYQITESDEEPVAGWLAYDPDDIPDDLTATFDEPAGDAWVTLYAWFKDAEAIRPSGCVTGRIIHTTQAPFASASETLAVNTYAGQPALIALAQIDAGSTGGTSTVAAVDYPIGIHHIGISTNGGASGGTLALAPGTHTVILTVTNKAGNAATDTCAVTVTDAGDATATGSVTWNGGAGALNPEWFRGQNWAGGVPPANPTAGTVNYGADGQAITGLVEADRQVGSIFLPNSAYSHALDFGGNTLTVAGTFQNQLSGVFTLTNGTLRIGSDAVEGNIALGGASGAGTPCITILRPGMVLDPHRVDTITVGRWPVSHINNHNARLDIRGVTVAGGVLGARTIRVVPTSRQALGSYIALDSASGVESIVVTNDLIVGMGTYDGRAFIGDPADANRRLPPGVAIRVGSGTAQRGQLVVGSTTGGASASYIDFSASSGGDIVAYLTALTVMRYNGTGTQTLNATLDLSVMTGCLIDTLALEVGVNVPGKLDANPRGTIKLPTGTLTAGTAVIGGSAGLGFGRFVTSNTAVTVTSALTLDATGEITVNMGGVPQGIDVSGTFTDGGGKMHVNFLAEPQMAGATNWALRVQGDVSSALNAMVGSGRLTAGGSFDGWKTAVVYDGAYTYFAMVDDSLAAPLVAVAQDATFEIGPGGTVWVDISEIDAGSNDPAERTPVAVTMSTGGPFATNLSFNVADDYPVTVKIEVGDPVEDSAADDATIRIVPLDPGSTANRTWLGAASTVLMDRREWWWSGNWLEGTPPTNPTPGTLVFAQYGQGVTSLLEQDRQVGGISVADGAYVHTHDLNGKVLTVVGTFRNLLRGAFTLTNGTLRIGTDAGAGTVQIGGGNGADTACTLLLRPGMVYDGYRVNNLYLDSSSGTHVNNMNGRLDLRGVTVAGGVLGASNIWVQTNYRNAGGSFIALDATTSLSAIAVTNELIVSRGQGVGRAFIGDPADANRRLPPGIDIRIGSASHRGLLEVGQSGGGYASDFTLWASSGGTIDAYLTDLTVMRYTGTGTAAVNGTLDLAAMTGCQIDVGRIEVGANVLGTADGNPRGTVRLPQGAVTAGTVEVGAAAGAGFGLLAMSNTAFTVTGALAVAKTGDVEVNVAAAASGLYLLADDPDALDADADATLTVRFLEPAASKPHYGLRWAGDHQAALNDMAGDGRLVIDDAGLGKDATVFVSGGVTYVGLSPAGGTVLLVK